MTKPGGGVRPYSAFAGEYDALMSHIPYCQWAASALSLITANLRIPGVGPTLSILDTACGTGLATLELARAGHSVVGLDLSGEMLSVATDTCCRGLQPARRPLFVQGDITDMPFVDRFHAITCFCDGLNHLDGQESLSRAFSSARRALRTGGVYVFDLNTPYKLMEVLGNNTFVEEFDGGLCIMDNSLRDADGQVDITLTFFKESEGGLYAREDESHTETWFDPDAVVHLLGEAGFRHLGAWDGYGLEPPTPTTERVVHAALAV